MDPRARLAAVSSSSGVAELSDLGLKHRLATPADMKFVEMTFRDSFRVQHWAGPLAPWDRALWKEFAEPQIRRILTAAGVEIHVAYFPDMSPESLADIAGWLAIRRPRELEDAEVEEREVQGPNRVFVVKRRRLLPLVIYTYVKDHHRERGVARGLFGAAGIDPWKDPYEYACRTDILMAFPKDDSRWDRPMVERMEQAQWNPRATRGGSRHERQDHDERSRCSPRSWPSRR